MRYFYSASTGHFYDDQLHGSPTIRVPDPKARQLEVPDVFVPHPIVPVPRPGWIPPEDAPDAEPPMEMLPDPTWKRPTIRVPDPNAPLVEVPNPACKLPADVVELTLEERDRLIDAQDHAKTIGADKKGRPVLVDRVTTREQVLAERARRLAASDWVVIRATELGEPVPTPWREHRQALRDVTEQKGFPHAVIWSTEPQE